MEESREESLVYVQRPNEISHSLSISKNPMKRRRCREDSSVAWYNLDKTKPVKECRFSEFDDDYRRTHRRRHEKAIVSDCDQFEDSDSDQVSQLSVGVETKKLKLNGDRMECLDSEVNICQHDSMETALFDVQVTVKGNHRAENVPYVCLTSQLNGQAILGYPVEIQELKSDDKGSSRFPRLVWKTAKRTPVCYVTDPLAGKDGEIVEGSIIQAGETKLLKNNPKKLNQGKEAKSRSCVPVGLVFSKILAAVGQLQS